jgi:hypothetical protein
MARSSVRLSWKTAPVEVELHVGVVGQQRHRHGAVRDRLRDHQRGQPHAERVVVMPGVPDRHLLRLPRLDRADADGLGRHVLHHAAARGARVLISVIGCRSTTRVVSLRYSRAAAAVHVRPSRRGGSLKAQCLTSPWPPCMTTQRACSQLRDVLGRVGRGKWMFARRHAQLRADAVEAQLHVGAGEAEREVLGDLPAVDDPLVHAPEVACAGRVPSSFTSRATSGSCSVGPIGPQMPPGCPGVACRQAVMYSSASAR